jgi:hypothetical protein
MGRAGAQVSSSQMCPRGNRCLQQLELHLRQVSRAAGGSRLLPLSFPRFYTFFDQKKCGVSFWGKRIGLTFDPFVVRPQWRRHVTGLLCAYGVVPCV